MNPTTRFSDKVEHYLKYRPDYPTSMITSLEETIVFSKDWIVADIGSGTGKSTALFVENGNTCYAIEPNTEMREAGEILFVDRPNFKSIDAAAEETRLEDSSVDLIIAGQAFHWFDRAATQQEFKRILKPGGWLLLFWNRRLDNSSDLMLGYEQFLLKYATDYQQINHRNITGGEFTHFFGDSGYQAIHLPYHQVFDLEGLIGRYLSCSYSFDVNHPSHEEALRQLTKLFTSNQENGKVQFMYRTELFLGQI